MIFKPIISVAICTFNRADRLDLALNSIYNQSLKIEYFEVLVVDNASTDKTRLICQKYQELISSFHYIYEQTPGLSKARNTALESASGQYIAYLDDDAIPCECWLEVILETFKTVKPTPVGVGGSIQPIWELPKPDWVHRYMEDLFSLLDCGDEPQWFQAPKFPYGANMAYQREALTRIGGFCEQLGRKGQNLLSEEERLLNLKLEKQGERFYYHPQASVQHWVPKERINVRWVTRRSYWQGKSVAMVDHLLEKPLAEQRWESIWKVINLGNFRRFIAQIMPDPKVRIWTRLWLYWNWGYFSQVWFELPVRKDKTK